MGRDMNNDAESSQRNRRIFWRESRCALFEKYHWL